MRGALVLQARYLRQVLYGTSESGELKEVKESMNGVRERKASYIQHGPARPAMRIRESEPD